MENFDKFIFDKSFQNSNGGSLSLNTYLCRDTADVESIRQETIEKKVIEEHRHKGASHENGLTSNSLINLTNRGVGHDDDSFRNPQLYQNPFTPEQWETSFSLDARVFQMDKKAVSCDCLVDPDEQQFEKRMFPRQLFDHLFEFEVGRLVVIKIRSKKGSMRIDVTDGRGIVSPEIFELENMWDSLKGF